MTVLRLCFGCVAVLGQDQADTGDQARAGQLWAGV